MIKLSLIELGLVETFDGSDRTRLRQKGWQWRSFEEDRAEKANERQLAARKDRADLLTKEWIYKTRFLPYAVSFSAFIISLLIYFSKFENKLSTQQQEKQLKKQEPKNVLLHPADSLSKTNHK